ncbi:MAG: hypothetical protein KJO40_07450 [Deltaproteobacteria bacterium]|nr:hypothetical protein [Deltaproteobacteria bacterium]NND28333.1 hypothetical protein [Myxococcales bacterium]MBT8466002.1 hypothetical protein [Deltaproteobacteria bacterium]MBT8480249.1 hypothetical protein [Deltaproteobacteria bacterium]NNK07936.1 hypothetical protein [Myxococcales bacterium]
MASVFRLGASAALLVAACASTMRTASTRSIEVGDLYPLQTGNAWSYDVDTGEASTTLAITRVESFDGRFAEVRTGQTLLRYEVLSQGIRVPSADEWVLRAPLEEGATWAGRGGRTARLVSTGMRVETRAGTFDDCVLVSETGGKLELEVQTVYCASVGPVLVESTMRSNLSDRALTVSAQLRGYEVSPTSSTRP